MNQAWRFWCSGDEKSQFRVCSILHNGKKWIWWRKRTYSRCLLMKERESNSLRGSGAKERCFFPTLFFPFLYCLPQPPVSQPGRWCAVLSFSVMFDSLWTTAHQAPLSMGILQARIPEWVATPSFRGSSQRRDWIQVSHIAGILFYHLSHKGIPWILEWVAYHFSRGSSQPRNWTKVFCIAGRFSTSWATREVQLNHMIVLLLDF